jgi:putative FmdB family regulatory protein
MPTYEYACRSCGQHLEEVQSFSDDPLTVCPNCAGELRKVFAPVGIVLKGSGFYKNDSRSSSGSKTGDRSESTSAAEGGDKKTPSSTESSPGGGGPDSKGSDTKAPGPATSDAKPSSGTDANPAKKAVTR